MFRCVKYVHLALFKGILGGLVLLTSELFNIIGRSVLLQHISFRFDIKQRVDIIRRRALTKSVVCSGRTVIFLLTLTALMPMTRISIIIYNQLTEADQGWKRQKFAKYSSRVLEVEKICVCLRSWWISDAIKHLAFWCISYFTGKISYFSHSSPACDSIWELLIDIGNPAKTYFQ